MNKWKKMIAAAAAFGAMALFAGCTTASAVSLDEAKDLVLETVGAENAVVVERESDRDDGVYELELLIEGVAYEFEVDSRTGQVREVEREDDPVPATTSPAETVPAQTQPARITPEEAKAIAYGHAGVGEAEVSDKSFESDDGRYEIDFACGGWEYEYDIGFDGSIVKSEKDRDEDHHDDNHHEDHHTSDKISAEKALSIALGHAGITDARDRDVEWEDGRWEVSFESDRTEYEYHISADGTVLRWEKENED